MDDNTAITLIVFVCVAAGALKHYFNAKAQFAKQSKTNLALKQQIIELQQEHSQLKQRIQTLEAIVTDEGIQLKQSINEL
ncbi:hypothetical protein [Parashewanella spongiae]|nr:hypothetical protein [Parashewanella spongiae]